MSQPPEPEPPPEEPYQIPGTTPAWSIDTLPNEPLTADRCEPLIAKDIA